MFGMTEPAVGSSDATNMSTRIELTPCGKFYRVNGRKWWSSGAGDPRCKVAIVMGVTPNPNKKRHQQHSMILVPMDSPGVKIIRPLMVFGFDDAPHGHMEVAFTDVLVPKENMLLGEGRGFEIAQGRLGPGRIHHCMRLIGYAETAFQMMCDRSVKRQTFGKPLIRHQKIQIDIARSRIEIDQARLLVLKCADEIDKRGTKNARTEIAMIKVVAPNMACQVIDRAIQAYGGGGVSEDTSLAYLYALSRTLRIADGPDEVHMLTIAKTEITKQMQAKL
jgi:alkylation response protein AidB-like acyl-CoA dehydrogenase